MEKAPIRTFCKVGFRGDGDTLPCVERRQPLCWSWFYLAEMDSLGHWHLYQQIRRNVSLFWPEAICIVESKVLESSFWIDESILTSEQYDLFVVTLPVNPKTYNFKDQFKALGGYWLAEYRKWGFPSDKYALAMEIMQEGTKDIEEEG